MLSLYKMSKFHLILQNCILEMHKLKQSILISEPLEKESQLSVLMQTIHTKFVFSK